MSNTIPLLFSIDPNNPGNGVVLNDKGNRAIFSLKNTLDLSRYKNPRLSLTSFSCFYTFPNIIGQSLTFESSADGVNWVAVDTWQIQDGLYSDQGLSQALSTFVDSSVSLQGTWTGLSVTLTGNYNTEKVDFHAESVDLSAANQLRLSASQDLMYILGLSQDLIFDATKTLSGDNQAHFNNVNSLIIGTSLLALSPAPSIFNERNNVKYLENINIDVSPGFQLVYRSAYPITYDLQDMVVNDIEVFCLDEKLNDIKMTNIWTIYLTLTYDK